jgi:hypothetical protein
VYNTSSRQHHAKTGTPNFMSMEGGETLWMLCLSQVRSPLSAALSSRLQRQSALGVQNASVRRKRNGHPESSRFVNLPAYPSYTVAGAACDYSSTPRARDTIQNPLPEVRYNTDGSARLVVSHTTGTPDPLRSAYLRGGRFLCVRRISRQNLKTSSPSAASASSKAARAESIAGVSIYTPPFTQLGKRTCALQSRKARHTRLADTAVMSLAERRTGNE